MVMNMKTVNLAVGLLLFCVAGLVFLGANMVFHDPTHNQNVTANHTPSDPSNDVEFAGTVSFQFEGEQFFRFDRCGRISWAGNNPD